MKLGNESIYKPTLLLIDIGPADGLALLGPSHPLNPLYNFYASHKENRLFRILLCVCINTYLSWMYECILFY